MQESSSRFLFTGVDKFLGEYVLYKPAVVINNEVASGLGHTSRHLTFRIRVGPASTTRITRQVHRVASDGGPCRASLGSVLEIFNDRVATQ